MNKIKNIIFEYTLLISGIMILLCSKYLFQKEVNNYVFVILTFIIYLRHYHKGQKIIVEHENKHFSSTRIIEGKKFFYPLDGLTYLFVVIYIIDKLSFMQYLILFVIWFIITDIFRQRYSIYGTYISRWFYTSKIEINNNKWFIHKNDVDPFPSVPHMHSKDLPLKLNIYNGEIFDVNTKKIVYIVREKDLKKLWSDTKFVRLVEEARKNFKDQNPNYKLDRYDHLIN